MLFAVIRLREKGRPLNRKELATQPRAIGDLHFCAPPAWPGRDPLKRPTRIAELRGEAIGGIEHTLIRDLMEPVLATVTGTEIVLFGFEMEHVDGALHEFVQGWLVRHLAAGEKRMRRGDVPM